MAVNNGPDDAPAAKVTLSDLDATTCTGTATKGSLAFASSECTWTIGELMTKEPLSQIDNGRDGEILTIITTAAVDSEITAAISNTQDYQVCIDSSGDDVDLTSPSSSACTSTTGQTWHTTAYYDYIDGNDSATIKAKDGTGTDLPSLRGAQARTAAIVVTWDAITEVSGRGVTHYEVQWSADGETGWTLLSDNVVGPIYVDIGVMAGDTRYYRVRAVNNWDHKGPWSAPMRAVVIDTNVPGATISETALTIGEGESAQYTVSLHARPQANVTVTVNGGGVVTPSPGTLTFTPSNFNMPQTVTLTGVQDNDPDNEQLDVTHAFSSSDAGYRNLAVDPVAVTVIDDDSGVTITTEQTSVNEGEDIVLTLTRTGNISNAITVSLTVTQAGNFLRPGESGARTVSMGADVATATVTVRTDNDTVAQEGTGSVTVRVNGGTGYLVGSPGSARVEVTDDDGPPGQPGNLVRHGAGRKGGTGLVRGAQPQQPRREVPSAVARRRLLRRLGGHPRRRIRQVLHGAQPDQRRRVHLRGAGPQRHRLRPGGPGCGQPGGRAGCAPGEGTHAQPVFAGDLERNRRQWAGGHRVPGALEGGRPVLRPLPPSRSGRPGVHHSGPDQRHGVLGAGAGRER